MLTTVHRLRMRELQSIAGDFQRFKDVTGLNQRATVLDTQQDVKAALDAERADEAREDEMTAEIFALLEELDISGSAGRWSAPGGDADRVCVEHQRRLTIHRPPPPRAKDEAPGGDCDHRGERLRPIRWTTEQLLGFAA
jgi:hypothetical protein